jgi:hypothetical protein
MRRPRPTRAAEALGKKYLHEYNEINSGVF